MKDEKLFKTIEKYCKHSESVNKYDGTGGVRYICGLSWMDSCEIKKCPFLKELQSEK